MAEYSLSKLACFTLHKSSCNWASFLLTSFGAYTWTHTALWPQQSWQSAPSSPLVKFHKQLKFGGKEVDGLSGCWQPLCVAFFLYTVSSFLLIQSTIKNRVQIKELRGIQLQAGRCMMGEWTHFPEWDCLEGCLEEVPGLSPAGLPGRQSQCSHRTGCVHRPYQEGHKEGRAGHVAQGTWITKKRF